MCIYIIPIPVPTWFVLMQTVLAKYYIEILNIAKESVDAKKLLNYRAPHAAKQVRLTMWYSVYNASSAFDNDFNFILPN